MCLFARNGHLRLYVSLHVSVCMQWVVCVFVCVMSRGSSPPPLRRQSDYRLYSLSVNCMLLLWNVFSDCRMRFSYYRMGSIEGISLTDSILSPQAAEQPFQSCRSSCRHPQRGGPASLNSSLLRGSLPPFLSAAARERGVGFGIRD